MHLAWNIFNDINHNNYNRNLFGRSVSTEQSGCEYSTGESESSDIQYSFSVPPSANVESGAMPDTMSSHVSLSDSDTESILEHTDLQQKEDSLEPSESDSEPETEGNTVALLKESNSEYYDEDVRPSVSRTYKYVQFINKNLILLQHNNILRHTCTSTYGDLDKRYEIEEY